MQHFTDTFRSWHVTQLTVTCKQQPIHSCQLCLLVLYAAVSAAYLGYYKGGCPIHLKGAPDVNRRRRRGVGSEEGAVPPPEKIYVFLISKWWVFMHSRWYLLTLWKICFFSKKAPNQKLGVRTPWTPPGSAPEFDPVMYHNSFTFVFMFSFLSLVICLL